MRHPLRAILERVRFSGPTESESDEWQAHTTHAGATGRKTGHRSQATGSEGMEKEGGGWKEGRMGEWQEAWLGKQAREKGDRACMGNRGFGSSWVDPKAMGKQLLRVRVTPIRRE
jgi:hypothetical protein